MAYLQEQMEILKLDKRMLEINLKNGTLNESDYKNHLAQLADLESQSEKLVLRDSPAAAPAEPVAAAPEVPQSNSQFEMGGETQQPTVTPPKSDPFGSGF